MVGEGGEAFLIAREQALRYVSHSQRTMKEVAQKLKERGHSLEVIREVLSFLLRYDYINDRKYAETYIGYRAEQGYSMSKICYELKGKGIPGHIAEAACDAADYDGSEAIKKAVARKLNGKPLTDEKERRRLANYLARRGFSSGEIYRALGVEVLVKEEE